MKMKQDICDSILKRNNGTVQLQGIINTDTLL